MYFRMLWSFKPESKGVEVPVLPLQALQSMFWVLVLTLLALYAAWQHGDVSPLIMTIKT